ncbi:DUF618 domain-containing protein [Sodiomyces alkalinus F11]|uniref:DUF618 domain-containing protein n=1 Tax=Sodiomyces alkalinus (strain CBS 110278 / VKM F-3762 / F11) TaxID=1314773 RepID=A0A3N2Q028_SODAK|nr:DUF618 domain-containing protein [Sodiomyces alkalinus F11]ROT40107.1 DUF618 domain-containing protein [Sodiomyces alkalinus F11]
MAFSDDSVLSRLSSLNESHDSIATAAQWIMFHRRHAERTAHIWLQRLRDSSSIRRLSLIYLANEVTQQSKARHRQDFVMAFSPIIAEALAVAYKGAPSDIQAKLRRVVEVWADRSIFDPAIQAAIEARLQDVEKSKAGSNGAFGSTTGSIPPELSPLLTVYGKVEKTRLPAKSSTDSADHDWDNLRGRDSPIPSAPVYAARLNGLVRSLATAEVAVRESIQARMSLIEELEKLLGSHREALITDEAKLSTLATRKAEIESKKQEIEIAIMRTLPVPENRQVSPDGPADSPLAEPERPEIEELTPPPLDPGPVEPTSIGHAGAEVPEFRSKFDNDNGPQVQTQDAKHQGPVTSGIEMLSNLASHYKALPTSINGSKKRRLDEGTEIPDLQTDNGIEPGVAEMLREYNTKP